MAVHLPDRLKLFLLLESEDLPQSAAPEQEKKEGTFDLIDRFLSETGTAESPQSSVSDVYNPASASDYTRWLLEENSPSGDFTAKLYGQELIDSFLEKKRAKLAVVPEEKSESHSEKSSPSDAKTTVAASAGNVYFTETLARIYLKQRRYEKALEIIKSLSLKYPEKSIYFADQIRFIEKLIIHTKS
jgi:hypothetical protein